MTTLKQHADRDWSPTANDRPTIEQLMFGALQRIADGVERATANTVELQRRLAVTEQLTRELTEQLKQRDRTIRGLRSVIARQRNTANAKIERLTAALQRTQEE